VVWAAVAVAIAAAAAVVIWTRLRPPSEIVKKDEPPRPTWGVADLAGAPACGGVACAAGPGLRVGDWLETDAASRARVAVADIGWLEVAPSTRLRLKTTSTHEHRLELARGTISARVNAPPRLLIVETPTANAVDLGCAYTLTVQPDGGSLLAVTSGWVGLEMSTSRTAYVPAGSVAETRPGKGVGTPRRADAPAELVAALHAIDFEQGGAAEVRALLPVARVEDTISLWHLLWRVGAAERAILYDRIRDLAPEHAPARDAIVNLDEAALSAWREELKQHW
jgi:hypothetical protein